jgi:hypothetical protein
MHRDNKFICKYLIPLRYEEINIVFFIMRTSVNLYKFHSSLTEKNTRMNER